MTFDKLVASDLAALASDSRAHPRPVADSLRELGLARDAAVAPSMLAGLALVPMASVYAGRVARTAVGVLLLTISIGFVIALANPFHYRCPMDQHGYCDPDGEYDAHWLTEARGDHILIGVIACVLATYAITGAIASRRFERAMERHRYDPETVACGLLRRIDGWSIALGIAGPAAFATMFGVVLFVLGAGRWDLFWLYDDPLFTNRIRDLAIAIPVIVIAAVAVGRSVVQAKARVLPHWRTIPLGLILGLVTLCVGFELDDGHISNVPRTLHPSSALRSTLTITGAIAVVVTLAGFALWQRRREHARCGITS